jgi:hypothetical protein
MNKPADDFFKFPIRIYDPLYDHEDAEDQFKNTGFKPPRDYVIGYIRVRVSDIISWGDAVSPYTDLKVVREKNKMLTSVSTKDDDYLCSWSRENFEENYNNYILGIEKQMEEEIMQELSADDLTPEFVEQMSKIIEDYKNKHQITK